MYGITYNDKHSFNDFNVTILNTIVIETTSKIKITETIPFMNGSYDFSNFYFTWSFNNSSVKNSYIKIIKTMFIIISYSIHL